MPCHWNKESKGGVPAVAQWVKNLTAVAQVAMKVWVRSLAGHSGLKDLALPKLQCGWDSVPGLRTSLYHWCCQKGGEKKKNNYHHHGKRQTKQESEGQKSSLGQFSKWSCKHG